MRKLLLASVVFLIVLQGGQSFDFSQVRFDTIQKQVPNDPFEPSRWGTILNRVDIKECLVQCFNDSKSEVCFYNSKQRLCDIANADTKLLSRGLFADEDTTTFIKWKEGTLSDFFFLNISPPWKPTSIHIYVPTIEACSDLCVLSTTTCLSFNFFPSNDTCITYADSVIVNGIISSTDVRRRNTNYDGMYFEKQLRDYVYFSATAGYKASSSNQIINYGDSCAEACLNHATCIGFTQTFKRECFINTQTLLLENVLDDGTSLQYDENAIYFEMWRTKGSESDVRYHIDGEITPRGFPISYSPVSSLTKVGRQGMKLNAKLTRLNLPKVNESSCVDQLHVNNEVFCELIKPPRKLAISSSETLTVRFHSDRGTEIEQSRNRKNSTEYFGYRIDYKMTWPCAGVNNPIMLNASLLDNLFNEGYPRINKKNADCAWIIAADSPAEVVLYFVKIPSNTSILSVEKIDTKENNTDLQDGLFGSRVLIKYLASQAGVNDSFLLYYMAADNTSSIEFKTKESITCDGLCKVETPKLFSNNATKYHVTNLRFDLQHRVIGSNTGISLTFNSIGFGHRDWFGDCQDGFINVYRGLGRQVTPLTEEPFAQFCGTQKPENPIFVTGWNITIIAKLYMRGGADSHNLLPAERQGFSLRVNTGISYLFSGEHIENDTILVPHTDDEGKYLNNVRKRWTIQGHTKDSTDYKQIVPRINVTNIQLATIPDKPNVCDNDRLVISIARFGYMKGVAKRDFYRFCGRQEPSDTLYFGSDHLPVTVEFSTDDRHTARGFTIEVTYARVYPLTLDDEGFDTYLVEEDGYLLSRAFPEMITPGIIDGDAVWNVRSKTYANFTLTLEAASEDEPPKRLIITYPNNDTSNEILNEKSGRITVEIQLTSQNNTIQLPNDTTITWIVKASEYNRFAAKVTFDKPSAYDSKPSKHIGTGKSKAGLIAGVVLGVLFGIAALVGIAVFIVLKKRSPTDDDITVKYERKSGGGTGAVNIGRTAHHNPGFQP